MTWLHSALPEVAMISPGDCMLAYTSTQVSSAKNGTSFSACAGTVVFIV